MGEKTFSTFFSQVPHIKKKKKAQIQDTYTLMGGNPPLCVGTDCSVWNLLVCRKHEVPVY